MIYNVHRSAVTGGRERPEANLNTYLDKYYEIAQKQAQASNAIKQDEQMAALEREQNEKNRETQKNQAMVGSVGQLATTALTLAGKDNINKGVSAIKDTVGGITMPWSRELIPGAVDGAPDSTPTTLPADQTVTLESRAPVAATTGVQPGVQPTTQAVQTPGADVLQKFGSTATGLAGGLFSGVGGVVRGVQDLFDDTKSTVDRGLGAISAGIGAKSLYDTAGKAVSAVGDIVNRGATTAVEGAAKAVDGASKAASAAATTTASAATTAASAVGSAASKALPIVGAAISGVKSLDRLFNAQNIQQGIQGVWGIVDAVLQYAVPAYGLGRSLGGLVNLAVDDPDAQTLVDPAGKFTNTAGDPKRDEATKQMIQETEDNNNYLQQQEEQEIQRKYAERRPDNDDPSGLENMTGRYRMG